MVRSYALEGTPIGWMAALGVLATALGLLAISMASGGTCEPQAFFALLAGSLAIGVVVVRLPGGAIVSLLVGGLLPAFLSCGEVPTVSIAVCGAMLGTFVRARSPGLAAFASIVGLVSATAGAKLVVLVCQVLDGTSWVANPYVLGATFVVGYVVAEWAVVAGSRTLWPATSVGLARSNLIVGLLLVTPAVVLADGLASRGVLLFAPLLLVLLAALALIALYLNAESDRQTAASERERMQTIVARAPDGIFAVDANMRLEWSNDSLARLTGWDEVDSMGMSCADVINVVTSEGRTVDHRMEFARAARSGSPVHIAGVLRGGRGRPRPVVISYTGRPALDGTLEVGVAAIRESGNAGAEETLDERTADLGHELRSPLSTILGYARLMASAPAGTLDASHQAEFIARISESGDYMLRLVNNLLDLRRIEAGTEPLQFTDVDVKTLLLASASMVAPGAVEKRITVVTDVPDGLPRMVTDELLLRRAIDNLVSNAVKYTPEGGRVTISAECSGDRVAFRVSDTGIGLTAEEQSRLFDRFFRSSRPEARRERGTGLGLALVHESARRLGGEVRVESSEGRGSTFTLDLPLRHAEAEVQPVGSHA